jgi:hypothetical protein
MGKSGSAIKILLDIDKVLCRQEVDGLIETASAAPGENQ